MALAQTIWSLDEQSPLPAAELNSEKELEDLLASHIELLNKDWLYLGRQVRTTAGKYIDLLCMDHEGDTIVVELKKDMTPREVVAQAIDYASCVADMTPQELAELYLDTTGRQVTLNEAYQKKYGAVLDEESVNQNVKMVVVAAKMDDSTERIIRYLRQRYEVDINILFFTVFAHGENRYISRVWLEEETEEPLPNKKSGLDWNEEFYVSFGNGSRQWEDGRQYGFISAGGGSWYSNTLKQLNVGDRVWVNVPHTGYVGVGIVKEPAQQAKDVRFAYQGQQVGFEQLPTKGQYLYSDDPETSEYVVKVDWIKAFPESQAVKEVGFFGNQNSVCKPRNKKWEFTIERLKSVWHIAD